MAAFYSVESIDLEDYDGIKRTVPVGKLIPLVYRTENKPVRLIEDKWLNWCNKLFGYQYQWTNIKIRIKVL